MTITGNPRRPPPAAVPTTDAEIARAIYNLHDVYLNATLTHRLMLKAPPWVDPARLRDPDPMIRIFEFTRSDRGRLERMWLTWLAVLDEAWRKAAPGVLAKIKSLTDTTRLESLLADRSRVEKLVSVRDYMVHRDLRAYWDAGRLASADTEGALRWNTDLHEAFGTVLLAAIEWANPILEAERSAPK